LATEQRRNPEAKKRDRGRLEGKVNSGGEMVRGLVDTNNPKWVVAKNGRLKPGQARDQWLIQDSLNRPAGQKFI
jgi:hypothetical protein